ncbi:MAG: sigma-70 family RNA polymerase sigma factor [Gemmatimonadales bacterium]|nr:MAG: sigma-70 family RNA polymerase sigma factor [Gemmatimonadales bacterium]
MDHGVPATVDYAQLDDRELAARACEGREPAFRELLLRYEKPVFSLVFRMVRNRETAEDVAQEAFVKAFNAIHTYNPSYRFSNWIFKIANNMAIDRLRKRELDTVSIDGAPGADSAQEEQRTSMDLPDRGETPDAYAENRELGSQIEGALGQLRPEYRTAVLLRHVEGHSYQEVSEIMDLPLGTVKTYIHRGRTELKGLLAEAAV